MTIEALAGVPANARNKLEFSYDHLGQRIQKTVYTWNVGTASYQLKAVTKLVYYQSSLLAEVDSNNALLRSYTWGRDQILLINEAGNSHAAAYDGTNNLTSLVKTNTGTLSAQYAYDPFGNTLRAIEVFAAGNPFIFAGKYKDEETDLLYYGFRFYSPSLARWVSSDPAGESGGPNLYAFTGNDAINHVDVGGLFRVKVTADAFIPWDWVRLPGNPVAPGAEYIHGDGRGPGNPWQGAFRMISWAEFEFPANVPDDIDKTVSKVMNNSSSTRQTRIGSYVISTITDRGTFTGRVDVSKVGPCEVQVQMSMSGGVHWLVGGPQPNIDYYYNVKLLRYTQDGADHVGATIQAKHDGFPGHELFLEFNQKVLYHRSYVPLWFSSEPAGKTAYPGPVTAVNGTRALAGQYNFQDWEDKAAYRVP